MCVCVLRTNTIIDKTEAKSTNCCIRQRTSGLICHRAMSVLNVGRMMMMGVYVWGE